MVSTASARRKSIVYRVGRPRKAIKKKCRGPIGYSVELKARLPDLIASVKAQGLDQRLLLHRRAESICRQSVCDFHAHAVLPWLRSPGRNRRHIFGLLRPHRGISPNNTGMPSDQNPMRDRRRPLCLCGFAIPRRHHKRPYDACDNSWLVIHVGEQEGFPVRRSSYALTLRKRPI
jgi:hypothetical protein